MDLQADINKLIEWANKWQMSFNVDKCSVVHIRHNNMQNNYNMSNQQLPTTDQQRVKVESSMAKSLPVENLLPQNVGSIINYLQ